MSWSQLDGSWRAVVLVGITLVAALALTGAAGSAYRTERLKLGAQHFAEAEDYQHQNKLEEAVEEYRTSLFYSPNDGNYRLALALALIQAGRLEEAQSHLEQLAEDEPTNPRIYVAIAGIAARRHQITAAINNYQRGVYEYWPPDQIPMRRSARWELVHLLIANNRRSEAIGELIQLYSSSPPEARERERIAYGLLQLGATSEAYRLFTDLARAYPQDVDARRGLAEAEAALGEYVAARHDFQRALRISPLDADSANQLSAMNSVIDLTASLPGISSAERLRRSENLLRRVLKNVSNCLGGGASFAADVANAESLLSRKHKPDEDTNLEFQQAADALWQQRAKVCGSAVPPDKIVDLAMARNASE